MAAIEVKAACGHFEKFSYSSGAGAMAKVMERNGLRTADGKVVNPRPCRRCPQTSPRPCTCQCDGWCENCDPMGCFANNHGRNRAA